MTLEQLAVRVAEQLAPLRGERLMIALSGGADSVALTLALCRLRDMAGWAICAAHVNHGLRGAESDGDQAFVEALCERHDLPLCCTRLSPPMGAGETWAREARYQALFDAARAQGCSVVVLGASSGRSGGNAVGASASRLRPGRAGRDAPYYDTQWHDAGTGLC